MTSILSSWRNVFRASVPFYVLILLLVITTLTFYFISRNQTAPLPIPTATNTINDCISNLHIVRLKDYQLIKPILLADIDRQSSELEETKGVIMDAIQRQQQLGKVGSVSVYLRKLSDGSWITINGDEQYAPGSLMKIAILISYLKNSENAPAILNHQLLFTKHQENMPDQNFIEEELMPGKKYTISELLSRMIINSDNEATALLSAHLDVSVFKKLFTDLNLTEPNTTQKDYFINVSDCAKFLRILYNSSYLNYNLSQYALELLTKSKFNKGLTKVIPGEVKVAHKFGESGDKNNVQLHEEGIVYVNNNPYLLVVMTKGKDFGKLSECIASLSSAVYTKFAVTP